MHFFLSVSCVPYKHPHFLFPHSSSFLLGNCSVPFNFLSFSLFYFLVVFIHPSLSFSPVSVFILKITFPAVIWMTGEHLKSRDSETEKLISHGEKSQKSIPSCPETKPYHILFWYHKHFTWTASRPWLGIYLSLEFWKAYSYFISMHIYTHVPIKIKVISIISE